MIASPETSRSDPASSSDRENQNSTRFRSDADYVGVGQTDDSAINGVHEIDRWLPAANANSDLLVEIGVSQETWPHAQGA